MVESIFAIESSDFYSIICNFAVYYTLISFLLYLLIEVEPNEVTQPKESVISVTSELSSSSNDEVEYSKEQSHDDEVLLSGPFYIKTTSIRIGKGWKLRYFRLKRRELSYFKDEDEPSKWCGSIMLNGNTIVDKLSPNQCYGKNNGMMVKTDTSSIVCYFLFSNDRDKWIDALRKHINSLRDRPVSMPPTNFSPLEIDPSVANSAESDSSPKKRPLSTFRRMKMAVFNRKENDTSEDVLTVSPKQSSSDISVMKAGRTAVEILEKTDSASSANIRLTSASALSPEDTVSAEDRDYGSEANPDAAGAGKKKRLSQKFRIFSSSHAGPLPSDTSRDSQNIGVAINSIVPDEDPTKFHRFLNEGESIIESAVVVKKNPFGIPHTRQLILTTSPRLIYVDPKDLVFKGEVRWMDNMQKRVEKVNDTTFKIDVDTRQYKFVDARKGAQYWVDLIRKTALQNPEGRVRVVLNSEATL